MALKKLVRLSKREQRRSAQFKGQRQATPDGKPNKPAQGKRKGA